MVPLGCREAIDRPIAGHVGREGRWPAVTCRRSCRGSGAGSAVPGVLRPGEFGVRTSYALTVNRETLLVDSLVMGEGDPALGALDDLVGGPRCLQTCSA